MSILDLTSRLTDNEKQFGDCAKSSDSLILIKPHVEPDGASVDLSVGDYWFDCQNQRDYLIEKEGIELHPGGFAVIETKEMIAVPYNAFGLLLGKGLHIFRGILISPSKIDPTFRDRLRIGVFNAGHTSVRFKSGEALCSCCFFVLETESIIAIPRASFGARVIGSKISASIRMARFIRDPIVIVVCTVLTALGTILSALFAYLIVHTKH